MSTTPHITQLREQLLSTLSALRDRENPMEPDRARAVAQVASVLVDTAKVEVDYIKATGAERSHFLEPEVRLPVLTNGATPSAHNPFPGATRQAVEG